MTKQLTPQQLLEIARVVGSDKEWRIFDGVVIYGYADQFGTHQSFEPHKPTERGLAQRWRILEAVVKKCGEHYLYLQFYPGYLEDVWDFLEDAYKVLCNDASF